MGHDEEGRMIAVLGRPDSFRFVRMAAQGCPDPFRVGNHHSSIDALSELASGRVAEGREGKQAPLLGSERASCPPLKGSSRNLPTTTESTHDDPQGARR